jgi:hypothetical protein
MDKMKFTIYDIFGYIIPGIILIWFMKVFFELLSSATPDSEIWNYNISITEVLVFAPLAYAIGHLLHAVTNALNIPPRDSLTTYLNEWIEKDKADGSSKNSDKENDGNGLKVKYKHYYCPDLAILAKFIKKVFQVNDIETNKLKDHLLAKKYFWACNMYVLKHHPKSITETFYGLLGFYRSMFLVSLLIGILFFVGYLLSNIHAISLIISAIAFLSFFLFRRRINDFSAYHYGAVFTDFIVIALEKTPKEKEKQKDEERITICEKLIKCLDSIYSSVKKESAKVEE